MTFHDANVSLPATAGEQRRVEKFWHQDVDELDQTVGREIGFDFAMRGIRPPEGCGSAVSDGWREGNLRRGRAAPSGNQYDRKLVRLRYSAWRRSRVVDAAVTSEYIELIQVEVCPITRMKLTSGTGTETDATIDRVYNGGGYALGNLAVMSQRANTAKANRSLSEIIEIADWLPQSESFEGLTGLEWSRLAALCSISMPATEQQVIRPFLVWPPDGLLMSNGYTIFQLSLTLLASHYMGKGLEAEVRRCFGGKKGKAALDETIDVLRRRSGVLLAGCRGSVEVKHALTDVWQGPLICTKFVRLIQTVKREEIVASNLLIKKAKRGDLQVVTDDELKGWSVETGGYVETQQ